MSSRVISADTRLATLEDCEHRIRSAARRGLEATCAIAKELIKINTEQLYELRNDTFKDYVLEHHGMTDTTCRRIVNIAQTVNQFQNAGLALPANESQVAELARLEPEKRASVWSGLLALEAKDPERKLTLEDVQVAIEQTEAVATPAPARSSTSRSKRASSAPRDTGIEVDMDNGEEPREKKVTVAGIVLTEKGEAALERIRKICGAQIAEAIETGNTPIEEKEIRLWAEQDADLMRTLIHYVTDQHWTVAKAISFEGKGVDDRTTVWRLILIARARGGRAVINYDGTKITVETPI